MTTAVQAKFDVGGVLLDRPFKVRRLGHFGYNAIKVEECRRFYSDLLGFKISDTADFASRMPPEQRAQLKGETEGYFMRYGGDHHAFVLFSKEVMNFRADRKFRPEVTINQITWQVGSLSEVGNAFRWFDAQGIPIQRTGRDMPGSNWHTYIYDPDGHTNELYYGIEQVGWQGYSKPTSMYDRGFREAPELPQISEYQEVQDALAKGVDLTSGYRHTDELPAKYDVDGIKLPRPFKITKIGPVSLFVDDIEASEQFYNQTLGFITTEQRSWHGNRCVFLRSNTEHHSLALYPKTVRSELGFRADSSSMAFGVQLANYRQLRDAVAFLREKGIRVETDLPAELYPGIDYAAHAFDADGHCVQLYAYMEQVGWDGKPRPADQRRPVTPGSWPEVLDPMSATDQGEAYQGPWG